MNDVTKQDARTRERLLQHCRRYPHLQPQDVCKYLFQGALGCEHLVSDGAALDFIMREYASLSRTDETVETVEELDGAYSRVPLSLLKDGLKSETLARLFCLSAVKETDGLRRLEEQLKVAQALAAEGALPFALSEWEAFAEPWRAAGYPAIRHSEDFRAEYRPAYRVIANRYANFLQVFSAIDTRSPASPTVVAIEGGSAGGKSTLADVLRQVYDCNVFHMDDFFLRPEQRIPQRLAEVGGNLDRERFAEEVLQPLTKGETVCYRRFDCATQTLGAPTTVPPKALTVVEGVYSMHPAFSRYYDLSVFLDIAPETQRTRITKRNSPPLSKRFFDEWIPMENAYFTHTGAKKRADLVLEIE